MQVRELEESLGVALVERSARQVRLTALGEDLAQRARHPALGGRTGGSRPRPAVGLVGRFRLGVIPLSRPISCPPSSASSIASMRVST